MSNSSISYNDKTDFVIPLHRYHYMVRTVIEAIYSFYSPRTIYIITPNRFSTIIEKSSKNWLVKKVVVIPEETFFIPIYKTHYNDLFKMYNYSAHDENAREFGWWYQQLLKIGARTQIREISDPYIVWDSDLIPLIKWNIYPTNENPYFYFAILQEKARTEWNNDQYRSSMHELIKMDMTNPNEGTFVPHHFVFYHDVLDKLINHIQFISNRSWLETIIQLSYKYYRFSEYRTVATFIQKYFPQRLKYHKFNDFGKYGKRIREPGQFLTEMHDFFGELFEISYMDFTKFVKHKYKNLPSYLQVEHI